MSGKQQEEINDLAYRLGMAEELLRRARRYVNDYTLDGFESEGAVKLEQMIENFLKGAS